MAAVAPPLAVLPPTETKLVEQNQPTIEARSEALLASVSQAAQVLAETQNLIQPPIQLVTVKDSSARPQPSSQSVAVDDDDDDEEKEWNHSFSVEGPLVVSEPLFHFTLKGSEQSLTVEGMAYNEFDRFEGQPSGTIYYDDLADVGPGPGTVRIRSEAEGIGMDFYKAGKRIACLETKLGMRMPQESLEGNCFWY